MTLMVREEGTSAFLDSNVQRSQAEETGLNASRCTVLTTAAKCQMLSCAKVDTLIAEGASTLFRLEEQAIVTFSTTHTNVI